MFPFVSNDNVLYFSSEGHDGNGGLDIFASTITDVSFSKPVNMGTQINSEKDDFAFIINPIVNRGYFSSNRKGGKGDDDIYSFETSPSFDIENTKITDNDLKNLKKK